MLKKRKEEKIHMLRDILIVILWYGCSGVTDTINAELVAAGGSSLDVTVGTLVGSSLVGYTWYAMGVPLVISDRSRWPAAPRLPAVAVCSIAGVNTVALWTMHESFRHSGIAYPYAFKHTEPLFTVALAFLIFGEKISEGGILGVVIVVVGAFVTSIVPSASAVVHAAPAILSLASTLLFALRTALTKPILNNHPKYDSCNLFVHVAAMGALLLLPVSFVVGENSVPIISVRSLLAGSNYFVYHCIGNYVLSRLSTVSYAMAKQLRVVVIFVASCSYGNAKVMSQGLVGLLGLSMVILGTYIYIMSLLRISAKGSSVAFPV